MHARWVRKHHCPAKTALRAGRGVTL